MLFGLAHLEGNSLLGASYSSCWRRNFQNAAVLFSHELSFYWHGLWEQFSMITRMAFLLQMTVLLLLWLREYTLMETMGKDESRL